MSGVRLAIVDDDPMVGQLMLAITERLGIEARFTTDPEVFLQLAREWSPSHVAIDLIMPQADGVELLAKLAEMQCKAKVIIISGVGSRVLDAAARSVKAHRLKLGGVLAKPFRPSALRELLEHKAPTNPFIRVPTGFGQLPWRPTEEDLAAALRRDELRPYFQPKLYCGNLQIGGFEALVRWAHPERGMIPPIAFIELAEATGLIRDLTDEMLLQSVCWFSGALRELETLVHPDALRSLSLSVNLSARSLNDNSILDRACRVCDMYGLAYSHVVFELTETAAMDDPVRSLDLLTRLRMKGFRLSIDDFGTGFSSMVQLVRLPFSEIKVDKSFVMTAMTSDESRTVARTVVELGNALALDTVAEGVEDEPTLDFLRSIGCRQAQGFHIAKPMPGADALAWTRRHLAKLNGLDDRTSDP